MSTTLLAKKVIQNFRKRGFIDGMRFLHYRILDSRWEKRLGIRSYDYETPKKLGIDSEECSAYSPISYRACLQLLRYCRPPLPSDVFLDFGCGQGRAVIIAATMPFAKVIGVELSERLCQVARENIAMAKKSGRLKCENIEIVCQDAGLYSISSDTSVVFFNNPFFGGILQSVISKIHESLIETPRNITILFGNPRNFVPLVEKYSWIKPVANWNCYPETGLAVYRASLPAVPKD